MLLACSSVYAESRVLPPVVDNSIYPGGSSSNGSAAPSANAMFEMLGRLEQLQLEVQQLRGKVEEQSQTIDDLKKRQRNIYSDLDLRLQEITGVKTGTVAIDSVEQNLETVDSSLTVSPKAVASAEEQVRSKPRDADYSPSETVAADNAPAITMTDKARYQSAYELLRNGHNSRAISEFKALLADSPTSEYADNSQYWLGEAYKVNQKLGMAKQAFLTLLKDYSDSPKVPDALLKIGYIEFEQKNMAKARDYLTHLTVTYPDTTAAHLAAKKLMQMEGMQF